MRKFGYLVVEGPHDVEFTYRLLSPFGLERVQLEETLDGFFAPLIPRKYPPDGDLQKRMPIPLFLQSETHAIAIHSAIGDSRLVATVEENASLLNLAAVTGIGVLLDSDKAIPAAERYADIKKSLAEKGFTLDDQPGAVSQDSPKLGAFVLPDNAATGTLEDLLIDSAQQVYPGLLESAITHVDAVENFGLLASELKEFKKPAGKNKALIGTMASILRPGKAIQVSIQDNRWLRNDALILPRIKAVRDFLQILFELP